MAVYLLRRTVGLLFLAFVAASATYLLAAVALHPGENWQAVRPAPSAYQIKVQLALRNEDPSVPLPTRYLRWLDGIRHGNLGTDILAQPVASDFAQRIGVSVRLLAASVVIGQIGGVLVGIWAAVRQYRLFDRGTTLGSLLVLSVPVVALAVILQMAAVWFNQLTGHTWILYENEVNDPTLPFWSWSSLGDRFQHLILPTISLCLGSIAYFSRYQRATMLDALGGEFLRTARGKGLTRRQAIFRHGARTAVIPVVTLLTYNTVLVFVGAVFTESVFNWHGMGEWFIQSVDRSDVNAVAAIGLFTAALVLAAGILSELATLALDPRVR